MKYNFFLLLVILLSSIKANAQLINCNPDPNGEPWIAGMLPEITPEIQSELNQIPILELNSKSSATNLPYVRLDLYGIDDYDCKLNIDNTADLVIGNNAIITAKNGSLIQYDGNVSSNRPTNLILDLEDNNWGNLNDLQIENKMIYMTTTNNVVTFDYKPKWSLGVCDDNNIDGAKQMSSEADSLWNVGEFVQAEELYKTIISEYSMTYSAENAMKKLLIMESDREGDFESLQNYYRTDFTISNNERLNPMGDFLANKCDENMRNYDEAITWYEERIESEATSYNDSVFATIDLGNLYLKMNDEGVKGLQGKLTQFVPRSREEHSKNMELALRSLKTEKSNSNPKDEKTNRIFTQIQLPDMNDHVMYIAEDEKSNQMIIVTKEGRIYATKDNCETMCCISDVKPEMSVDDYYYSNDKIYAVETGKYAYKEIDNEEWSYTDIPNNIHNPRIFVTNAGTIFLGSWQGIHKSSDGGASWSHVVVDDSYVKYFGSFIELEDGAILAGSTPYIGDGEILRSTDDGDTWIKTNGLESQDFVIDSEGNIISGALKASAGGAPMWYPFAISYDKGITWQTIMDYDFLYPRVTSMVIDDNNVIYSADGSGLSWGIYGYDMMSKEAWEVYRLIAADDNKNLFLSSDGYLYAFDSLNKELFLRSRESLYSAYNVKVIISGEGSGCVNGEGEYTYGRPATLTAEATEGHEFLSWTDMDGNILSTEETYIVYMTENIQLIANFSEYDDIEEIDDSGTSIYPNPTENNITIEAEDIIQIEVYNTLGQMVARIGAEGNSVELDMSDYSDGIYLIKTVSKEGSTVSRVVKM